MCWRIIIVSCIGLPGILAGVPDVWAQSLVDPSARLGAVEHAAFVERRDALDRKRSELAADTSRHNSDCSDVDPTDGLRVNRCQQSREKLNYDWDAWLKAVRDYNRAARLGEAVELHREALQGLAKSLESLAYQAAAGGLTMVSDHIRVGVLPGVLALARAPGPTLTGASFVTLAAVVDSLARYSDCSFRDEELRGTCENAKRFSERAQNAAKEIEKLRQ